MLAYLQDFKLMAKLSVKPSFYWDLDAAFMFWRWGVTVVQIFWFPSLYRILHLISLLFLSSLNFISLFIIKKLLLLTYSRVCGGGMAVCHSTCVEVRG